MEIKKEMSKDDEVRLARIKRFDRFYKEKISYNLDGTPSKIVMDACVAEIRTEDCGCSKTGLLSAGDHDDGFFVRLQSWDEHWDFGERSKSEQHRFFDSFVKQGKKLRITIEEI